MSKSIVYGGCDILLTYKPRVVTPVEPRHVAATEDQAETYPIDFLYRFLYHSDKVMTTYANLSVCSEMDVFLCLNWLK